MTVGWTCLKDAIDSCCYKSGDDYSQVDMDERLSGSRKRV